MLIKAVLFDLDNTLLDFSEMKHMAVNMAIRAMIDQGLDMDPDEAFRSIFETYYEVGIESDNAFSEFLKRRFGQVDERILAAGVNAYLRTKPSFLEPYPNVVPTLIKLIKSGLVIGILTDAPRLKGWQRLCAIRLQHFFDHVITRDDSGAPKTGGLPFEYALGQLKLSSKEVLFVGDSVERDIKGAGHYLSESYEVFRKLKQRNPDLKVSIFISGAGEEVLKMYGLLGSLDNIAPGGYMEEIFLEKDQGKSYPKVGRFLMDKYDHLIISPATSNTVAKITHGIADTLVTNAVIQAVKGSVPVHIVPVDIAGVVRSELPYNIDRDLCQNCEDCPPKNECPNQAFTDEPQIDLLLCDGCGNCIDICTYGAIKGGEVELKIRDIDSRNVQILRGLDEITVLDDPYAILELIL